VTVNITGQHWQPGVEVKLLKPGEPDIVASEIDIAPAHPRLTAVFDLSGRAPGAWTVVVTNPAQAPDSLPNAFLIVDGGAANLVLEMQGPAVVRAGREVSFQAVVRNVGLTDLELVTIQASAHVNQPIVLGSVPLGAGSTNTLTQVFGFVDTLAPGMSYTLPIPVTSTECASVGGTADAPDPDNCAELREQIRQLEEEVLPQLRSDLDEVQRDIAREHCEPGVSYPPGHICSFLLRRRAEITSAIRKIEDEILPRLRAQLALCEGRAGGSTVFLEATAPAPSSPSPSHQASDTVDFCPVTSWDPNDKVGPAGSGPPNRQVPGGASLPYTVFFENLPAATAPAQEVVITDQLDTNLDWSTFALGDIRMGDRTISVPAGLETFVTTLDLRPENDLLVRISGHLDSASGVVTWRFLSLDPETSMPPDDPLAGFLPPNIAPPEGEGSVSFTVQPKQGLPTGTQINNRASIVFDVNPPIETPAWLNTIDQDSPASQVSSTTPAVDAAQFDVNWSGSDSGSGIEHYTLFVSELGEPYGAWLQDEVGTTGTFQATGGKAYRLYSIARDHAGNYEDPPFVPDAVEDLDGCATSQELGDNPSAGGKRDPLIFWDFFDVPAGNPLARDRRVTIADINAEVARFGSVGDASIDPLSLVPAAPAYHPAYDRTFTAGGDPWDTSVPDGRVTILDITLSVAQFGHQCAVAQ
jgi:hypothetical protein